MPSTMTTADLPRPDGMGSAPVLRRCQPCAIRSTSLVTPAACFATIYQLARFALCAAFIYAAVSKLSDPRAFAVVIEAFGFVPDAALLPIAIGLPALEVVAAIALAFERKGGLTSITLLLLLFIAILGYGIHMGLAVDCGCFGPDEPEARAFSSLYSSFIRDMAMLAGCAYLYGWRWFREKEDARRPPTERDTPNERNRKR